MRRAITPMTIVERELVNNSLEADRSIAIRRDGAVSIRSLKSGKHNTGTEARNLTMPNERKYVVIADAVGAVSTFYFDEAAAARARTVAVSPRCENLRDESTLTGQESLLGYQTYKFEMKPVQINGIEKRETIWLAPILDCRPLRFEVWNIDPKGSSIRSFLRTATSIVVGDPDASLFVIPPDFREVPPSQASRELRELRTQRSFGTNPRDQKLLTGMARMDEQYVHSQQYRPQ